MAYLVINKETDEIVLRSKYVATQPGHRTMEGDDPDHNFKVGGKMTEAGVYTPPPPEAEDPKVAALKSLNRASLSPTEKVFLDYMKRGME